MEYPRIIPLTRKFHMDRQTVVDSLTPQIGKWIKGYIGKRPELRAFYDDFLGVAHLRFVEVLDRFDGQISEKFGGNLDKFSVYVRLSICTAVSDYLKTENRQNHATLNHHPAVEDKVPTIPLSEGEVLTKLFEITQDRRDAEILEAKLKGTKTAKEVAAATGLSATTVYRRLRVLKSRYGKR